jgi:hypothetical protein
MVVLLADTLLLITNSNDDDTQQPRSLFHALLHSMIGIGVARCGRKVQTEAYHSSE